MLHGKTEEIILRVLDGFPEVRFCTLFGSAVHGRITARSDVDIAVAEKQIMPVETRMRLSLTLSAALSREIDLIDLHAVSGAILEEALCNARVVKNSDHVLYASLLKRMWFDQADMMPYVRRMLEERIARWLR
jgi:predicted nucleotidyltransferase